MLNVPKLRFGEFEGEYKEHLFNDIFLFSTGKNIKQKEASPEFETPCVRYGELYHMYNEVIYKIINRTNLDKSELRFSKGDEILLPSAGEDPFDIGSASALTLENVAIGRTINILRPITENVYSQKYVAYYINEKLKRKISTLAKGSSISNVYNSDLKKLKIIMPTLKEQQKVSKILTSIDQKTEQLTQKKTLLESYKKGVMQKIFSQELRFKCDDGGEFEDWKEEKLENYLKESRIKGLSGDKAKKLTVKLWGQGVYIKNEIREGSSNTQYYIRKEGQFIYSKLDFLNCAFGLISNKLDGYESTVDLPCFDFIKDVNKELFLERIKQKNFYKKNGDIADGSRKAKRIHADTFLSYTLFFPCLEEQQKIANFLTSLDKKITQTHQKIEAMKSFKKGLLQQMFV